MANPNWTIRAPFEDDIHFLYSTWLNAIWRAFSPAKSGIRKTKFFGEYPKILDETLKNASVGVACKVDDPTVLYGYVVYGEGCIYALCVKEAFRRFGIGTSLYNYAKGKQTHGKAA